MRWTVSLAAIAILGSASAAAKGPPAAISPYVNALENCRTLTDPAQRLACYDKTAPALIAASKSGEINIVDRGQLRQARRSLFGFSMPKLPFFAGDQSVADTPDQIDSTIKSVREGYGRFQIVIADGNAVWETTEESISLNPRVGQKITIRRGPMGSYFLRINGQAGVKGRRVG